MNDTTTQTPIWAIISIILNVLLIIIIAVGSYVFYIQNNSHSATANAPLSAQTETQQQKLSIAIQSNDLASCNDLTSAKYKATCNNSIVFANAQKTGDISSCKDIVSGPGYTGKQSSLVHTCEVQTINNKALTQKDSSVCNEQSTKTEQAECKSIYYFSLAQNKNDIKVCDTAKDTSVRNECFNTYTVYINNTTQKPLSCGTLRGAAAQKDCRTIEPLLTSTTRPNQKELSNACSTVTSATFSGFCKAISGQPVTAPTK